MSLFRNKLLMALVRPMVGCWFFLGCLSGRFPAESARAGVATNIKSFIATGVVQEIHSDSRTITIAHDAITNYMPAMTMPFNVKAPSELNGVQRGDRIVFRLSVTENESWVEQISKVGTTGLVAKESAAATALETHPPKSQHPLMAYQFTNELGQAVSLSQFNGQALALTFFFTRCPIPDFCPRLSKNFEEAARKLTAQPQAPTNWHFLSVTFDPEFDTPSVLKSYAERYQYDPKHWSFITGPADKIQELASQSDVKFERDGAFFNHNFRTLIIDAAGHLQMIFPMGGDLSEAIVAEILKAATVTNGPS